MGKEMCSTMSRVYSDSPHSYKSLLKPDSLLLNTKQQPNGKAESVKNCIQFSDPLLFEEKNGEAVFAGECTSGEETAGGETTETESKHSDEEEWHSAPPDDYLEHVEVLNMLIVLDNLE